MYNSNAIIDAKHTNNTWFDIVISKVRAQSLGHSLARPVQGFFKKREKKKDKENKKLGSANLKALLEEHYEETMDIQKKNITDYLSKWQGSNMALDDVLLIGFEFDWSMQLRSMK